MVSLALDWTGDLTFGNAPDNPAIELHSSTKGKPSPPEALAYAVMACMGMDVVHVIKKGRHRLDALRVEFKGHRAPEPPKRFVSMTLTFDVTTSASAHVVERAIAMSREKYCSVWHTIRPDVEMSTAFVIRAVDEGKDEASADTGQ